MPEQVQRYERPQQKVKDDKIMGQEKTCTSAPEQFTSLADP